MPTSSGQFLLDDYDQELINSGFDGIDQSRRYRWINFGYRRVASIFPWLWEKYSIDVALPVGDFSIDFVTDIPNFRSLEYIYDVTPNSNIRLHPVDDKQFYENYMAMDLTAAANRSTPGYYKIENNQIYILPPPSSARTIRVLHHRRVTQLTKVNPGVSDLPITPQYLDEGILMAVYAHAHKRVYELQLAAQSEADLGAWVDQMRIDEDWQDIHDQERVEPDDTWL